MKKRNLYIIAGANGSGKTTFARVFLPKYAKCNRFVNPDLIAQGLSPFDPQHVALRAGRLVLEQIHRYMADGLDFAFESTLSGKTYQAVIRTARRRGYRVHIFFLWIPSPTLALARIADRVAEGGHDVPERDVRRRFRRTLNNLVTEYRALADAVFFFDNSGPEPFLIFKEQDGRISIRDKERYTLVMKGWER